MNPTVLRRIALTVALVAVVALAWLGPLDEMARNHVNAGLKRALATFAVARTANAVISVLQSTTVSTVVVSASPGQALDPLNDVVEDFSNLMLAACVSLGAQRLLISIGALHAISAALTLFLLLWAWCVLRGRASAPWLRRIVVLLLFVRFAVPLSALGSEAAFRFAMSDQYTAAESQVELSLQPPAPIITDSGTDMSVMERLKHWFEQRGADVKAKVDQVKSRMEHAIEHVVTLMAIFIVQTAVLPLLFLWLSYRFFGATVSWPLMFPPRREP